MNKGFFLYKTIFGTLQLHGNTRRDRSYIRYTLSFLWPSAHSDGVNTSPPPYSSKQPLQEHVLPFEVAGGDVVKHRIQAGVKGDEGHGDPAGDEDLVGGGATLDDIHSSEKVQQIHNMVGQEAEQRDGQDGVDDPHRPLGCFGLDQGDSPRSQWVTHQDDERGQQRAEDETEHGVCPQARVPLVFGKVLKAAVASWFIHVGF